MKKCIVMFLLALLCIVIAATIENSEISQTNTVAVK